MFFFNGSDAALAAGYSLIRQLLPHVQAVAASLPSGLADGQTDSLQVPDKRVDRALIESILLGMDAAPGWQGIKVLVIKGYMC